ncbi:MAG: hypothetical protein KDK51_09355 [Deltaproteobacteria bacterium]|nr:hypothetical protein [Deltaproteobacteria bacterium]
MKNLVSFLFVAVCLVGSNIALAKDFSGTKTFGAYDTEVTYEISANRNTTSGGYDIDLAISYVDYDYESSITIPGDGSVTVLTYGGYATVATGRVDVSVKKGVLKVDFRHGSHTKEGVDAVLVNSSVE